jgi:Pectinacetylesterase
MSDAISMSDAINEASRPLGSPIQAPAQTWTWVDFPAARCRDGSGTGIGVNWFPGSEKLAIFLEGGGYCVSAKTCSMNSSQRGSMFNGSGIYDRGNASNPLADWNLVYVPYCTGDVHAGNNPKGNVPGVGPQQFMGYANLALLLEVLREKRASWASSRSSMWFVSHCVVPFLVG